MGSESQAHYPRLSIATMLGNQLPKVEQMFRNAQRRELLTHGSSQPPHEVEKARIQRQCSSDESPDRPRARHGRPGQNEPPSESVTPAPSAGEGRAETPRAQRPTAPGRRGDVHDRPGLLPVFVPVVHCEDQHRVRRQRHRGEQREADRNRHGWHFPGCGGSGVGIPCPRNMRGTSERGYVTDHNDRRRLYLFVVDRLPELTQGRADDPFARH